MNGTDFQNWLKQLAQSWEDKDTERFSGLFTEDARYFRTPFEDPKSGRKEIGTAINKVFSACENIKFGYEIISFSQDTGVCRWWCKFVRGVSQELIKLDGVFICEFNNNKSCKIFRKWWLTDGEFSDE